MVDLFTLLQELPLLIGLLVLLSCFLIQTLFITFPIYIIMFYAGMNYGIWWGALLNFIGMIITTSFGYLMGLLGKMDEVMEHPALKKFKIQVEHRGLFAVGFLRVIPLIPYNVTSIGSGVLKIDFKRYLVINNLAILPYAFLWSFLGDYFGSELVSRFSIELTMNLLYPTLIFFTLVFFGLRFLKKKYKIKPNEILTKE